MKETVTCWIQKDTHNRLKVFCALHRLSMMQVITQAVKEWLEQHGFSSVRLTLVADGEPVGKALREAVAERVDVVITSGASVAC